MKKLVKTVLFTAILSALPVLTTFAKSGDVIGYAKYTDISAYINHYPITSYNINGNTAVVAEDLANYGFNVAWDDTTRTLTVTRSGGTTITPYGTVYKYSSKVGQNSFPIYETDIVTYVNNAQVESFAIGGKTCVYIDSLASYGELNWVPEQRATKLWISGLPIKDYSPLPEAVTTAPVTSSTGNTSVSSFSTSYNTLKNALISKGTYYKGSYAINDVSSNGMAIISVGYDTKEDCIHFTSVYYSSDGSNAGTYIEIKSNKTLSGILSVGNSNAPINFNSSGVSIANANLNNTKMLNFVNTDLKIYNLFFTKHQINVKLSDFGIYY